MTEKQLDILARCESNRRFHRWMLVLMVLSSCAFLAAYWLDHRVLIAAALSVLFSFTLSWAIHDAVEAHAHWREAGE